MAAVLVSPQYDASTLTETKETTLGVSGAASVVGSGADAISRARWTDLALADRQ